MHGRLRPMPATPEDLFARLDELGIETTTHEHPPLFTVEESKRLRGALPGGHTKNLFVRDKRWTMWLVVALEDREVDMKALRRALGAQKSLSFGDAERMRAVLGIDPGAVTAFALINDTEHQVNVVVDEGLLRHETVNAHPLTNTATTALAAEDLLRFIRACGHEPQIIDLGALEAAADSA